MTLRIKNLFHHKNRYGVVRSSRDDLIQIAHLSEECFDASWSETQLLELFDSHVGDIWHVNVQNEPEHIVAYLLLHIIDEEAEILSIGTVSHLRRSGCAHKLLTTVIEHLRSQYVRQLFLEVAANNHAALKLYQELGFRIISQRKGYYAETQEGFNIDALMMMLEL